jgi:hypothetical protein
MYVLVGDQEFSTKIVKIGPKPDPNSKVLRSINSLIQQHATAVGLDISGGGLTPFNYLKSRTSSFHLDASDNSVAQRLSQLLAEGRAFKKQSNPPRI